MLDEKWFREYLNNKRLANQEIQSVTALRYLDAIHKINQEMYFRGMENEIKPTSKEMEDIITTLSKVDGKESPPKIKIFTAAIRVYSKGKFKDNRFILSGKEYWSLKARGKEKPVEPYYTYEKQFSQVNKIVDKGVRIAMRTQLACGLRINELCNLRKKDIDLETRQIFVARDKGGGEKVAYLIPDKYVDRNLKELMVDKEDDDLLFPPKEYVQSVCSRYGIISHDNRKHYIRERYKERVLFNIKNHMPKKEAKWEALNWVSKLVGHNDIETTKKFYLGNVWRKRKEKS